MAITTVISATKDAASGVSTEFTTTGPFVLYGDGFGTHEHATLLRLGPSGSYLTATNNKEVVKVSAYPNMVYIDTPGTFRVEKMKTHAETSVGYEEV